MTKQSWHWSSSGAPEQLARLFAGAYLLWLMDGGRFLRVHNGQCFLYHDSGGIPSLLWKPAGANCSSSEGIHHAGRGAIPNFAWRSRRNGWWHSKWKVPRIVEQIDKCSHLPWSDKAAQRSVSGRETRIFAIPMASGRLTTSPLLARMHKTRGAC